MSAVDPRLVASMREQLASRPRGAARVGWTYGSGDGERIGGEIAVGHLMSATTLVDGATYRGGGAGDLHADAELAVQLGEDGVIARYGAALELVDLANGEGPEAVVARNVYHRAVAFGPLAEAAPAGLQGALVVNGEPRATGPAPGDVDERLRAISRVLEAVGEGLRGGDRVISGLIVQVPVEAGDEVVADLGALGRVSLRIA